MIIVIYISIMNLKYIYTGYNLQAPFSELPTFTNIIFRIVIIIEVFVMTRKPFLGLSYQSQLLVFNYLLYLRKSRICIFFTHTYVRMYFSELGIWALRTFSKTVLFTVTVLVVRIGN